MFNFLKEDSQVSTTRIVLFLISLCICLLSATISFNVIYISTTTNAIDWIGISAFISSLSTLIGVAMYGKVKQKSIELDNKPLITE